MPIALNGKTLLYRIGTTDRVLGATSNVPNGFLVLNTTNNSVFVSAGGVWVSGSMDPVLLAAWKATTVSNAGPGEGYRIGTTDRVLGATSNVPNGFLVLNTTNNSVFVSAGGVWVSGGPFPAALLNAWNAA